MHYYKSYRFSQYIHEYNVRLFLKVKKDIVKSINPQNTCNDATDTVSLTQENFFYHLLIFSCMIYKKTLKKRMKTNELNLKQVVRKIILLPSVELAPG